MPRSADLPWPTPLCESVPESVYKRLMVDSAGELEKVGHVGVIV